MCAMNEGVVGNSALLTCHASERCPPIHHGRAGSGGTRGRQAVSEVGGWADCTTSAWARPQSLSPSSDCLSLHHFNSCNARWRCNVKVNPDLALC